jgi:hypothetical protein
MPLRFLTRLRKNGGKFLYFRIPKYVKDFYQLRAGNYRGGVTTENGSTTSCRIWFSKDKNTLNGRVPVAVGLAGSIVEIWMYRDTWSPPEAAKLGKVNTSKHVTSVGQIGSLQGGHK